MTSALKKVDTTLSERWVATCKSCRYQRQMFGTEQECRTELLRNGWEFRVEFEQRGFEPVLETEIVYCPHCALLVRA